MNRKQLLQTSFTEEKNVDTLVSTTLSKDTKALKKLKRDISDKIEEVEEELEERLSSNVPLDKSVVEVTYSKLKDLKESLSLYEAFEKEYLTTSN